MNEQKDEATADKANREAHPERSPSTERLVARLAELRGKLATLEEEEPGREALEGIREAQERIAALDAMLTAAREREQHLTVELIRQRARVTEYEARISELGAIAARVAAAEESRREAEAAAAEHERGRTVADAELEALRAEAETHRSRIGELEADLAAVSDELAEAAVARTEASRLEKERNEARERAHTERRLAAADRIRAAEAELRATELQGRLRAAERRIVKLANAVREPASDRSDAREEEEVTQEPPWIELQRANAASDTPQAGAPPRPDVIDLTEVEEEASQEDDEEEEAEASEASERRAAVAERPTEDTWVASAPEEESRLHRLIHPRRRR